MPVAAVMAAGTVASSVAGGIFGNKAAKAQKKAAQAAALRQENTTNKNVALQTDMYNKNTGLAQNTYAQQLRDNATGYNTALGALNTGFDQANQNVSQGYGQAINTMTPFASSNALMGLHDMMGIARPGETSARPYDFQAQDPSYAWRLKQGQAALDRSAASRGLLLSGSQIKGAQEYGQGMASQEYGNQFSRLSGMANQAQSAAGTVANLQQGQGSALANLATGRGSALSGLATSQANNLNQLGQSNLSNLSTLNSNHGNTLANLYQTGTNAVNGANQDAATAQANGYLSTSRAIQSGISGLTNLAGQYMPGAASPVSGGPMSTAPWAGGTNGYGTQSGYSPNGVLLRGSTGMLGGGV